MSGVAAAVAIVLVVAAYIAAMGWIVYAHGRWGGDRFR